MYPVKEGQVAHQANVGLPSVTYEEEHGRKGFFGKSAHICHAKPSTGWTRFEGKLRPHPFDLNLLLPTDQTDPQGAPAAILGNAQIRISLSRRSLPMPFYYRNSDYDELLLVHRGTGFIETDFGPITFEPGDYIILPHATTYRIAPNSADNFFLLIESKSESDPPEKGFPGQHAFCDPSIVTIPGPVHSTLIGPEWELRILSDGEYAKAFYPFHPMDGIGWKDDVFAWKINLRDIRPIMSHRAHLPSSAHTTFVTEDAVVCSFLPRPLEEAPEAMRVPFFHCNTDYDDDFVSKDNIKPGMATLHPGGIHHSPHPKTLANQANKTHTDEYAVMLDSLNPVQLLPAGEAVERADYWASWQTGAKSK